MSIVIESTTDTKTNVQAAMSSKDVKESVNEDQKSAPESEETTEQNETEDSDTEETEEKEQEGDSEEEESDEDSSAKDSEKEKPKKKGGFQRRIDKLNAAKSAAQREAEYWKEQAMKVAGKSDDKPKVETKTAAVEGKPNPDSFDTHAEYVEALADWKTEQKLLERDQKLERSKLEVEQSEKLKSHTDRVNSFTEKHEDFFDVLESVDDIPVSPAVSEIFVSSENGPELMYELAKNRKEFERINQLTPLAAARELGKIEARLSKSSEEKTEPKKLTKAPKPIAPVGSKGGHVEKSIYDQSLSQKEYEALRLKQRQANA